MDVDISVRLSPRGLRPRTLEAGSEERGRGPRGGLGAKLPSAQPARWYHLPCLRTSVLPSSFAFAPVYAATFSRTHFFIRRVTFPSDEPSRPGGPRVAAAASCR